MDNNELLRLLKEINKGREIVRLGKDSGIKGTIPTGSYGIDTALKGGWPTGRVVLLYGATGGGKSTLALIAAANAQKAGGSVLWIDSEISFDPRWATNFGVDVDSIPVIQSKSLETILYASEIMLGGEDENIDVIVVDSISSIQADKYYEQHDSHAAGTQAKVSKELIFKLQHWAPKALIIIVSQATMDLSNFRPMMVPTGGNALKHASTVTIWLRSSPSDIIKTNTTNGDKSYDNQWKGMNVHWKLTKSRVSEPYIAGTYAFYPEIGIDIRSEVIEAAVKADVIHATPGWTLFEGEKRRLADLIKYLDDSKGWEELKGEISRKLAEPGEERTA